MKTAREVEFEVLPKEREKRPGGSMMEDPLVAFIARLMDNLFTLPGTRIRFGLDPLIGLLPGVGDTASALVSGLLIFQSARHGVPKVVLARMVMNVLINTVLGAIPVAGDVFSLWFKSNVLNYELLQKHGGKRGTSTRGDWLFVAALLGGLGLVVALLLIGAFTLMGMLYSALFHGSRTF